MSGLLDDARAVLSSWDPPGPEQAALRDGYLAHLAAHPDGIWRDGPAAHLTASCFVLDAAAEQTLLTLHRKGRFWVQVGGHLEPGDATLAAAALREATEETGVPGLRLLGDARPRPVDLDRHALTAAFGRCREHLDVAYAAIAPDGARPQVSDESDDVAWWPVDDLPDDVVPDLRPRLARVVALVRAAGRPAGQPAASSR